MSRTLVGIGCTSGLGFEALKQLLTQSSPGCARWRVILSARSPESGQSAVTKLQKCTSSHTQITWLPLDLARFPSDVISFSDRLKQHLEADHSTIDCLLLNAGMYSTRSIVSAGRWCQEAIVNHFAQHLIVDPLKDSLTPPAADNETLPQIVYVSSSLQDRIKSASDLKAILNGTKPDATPMDRYAASKLAHAISATMWKRKLKGQADVIAVSPGFVPTTALNRDGPWHQRWFMQHVLSWAPFATSLHDGAASIVRALAPPPETLDLLVKSRKEDEVLYLGVKGETRHFNPLTLDQELQTVWCPSRKEMDAWK